MGAALATGLTACDNLPIDPSNVPDITRSPDAPDTPTAESTPEPTDTAESTPEPRPTETVTAEPEPTETAAPEEADDEESEPIVWWPWVLAAVVLLIVLVVWLRARGVRRDWDNRLAKARSELAWLEDSLTPQILSKPTAAEAASLWQAAKPRVLEIDRALHGLSTAGPSADRTTNAAQGLEALRGLTSAIDEETSTQPGGDADALRARRAALDASRSRARTWVTPPGK